MAPSDLEPVLRKSQKEYEKKESIFQALREELEDELEPVLGKQNVKHVPSSSQDMSKFAASGNQNLLDEELEPVFSLNQVKKGNKNIGQSNFGEMRHPSMKEELEPVLGKQDVAA